MKLFLASLNSYTTPLPIGANIYVSKTGSDANTGTQVLPFLTINKAKDYVKNYIDIGYTGYVTVNINEGEYNEVLDFTQEDSGNNNLSITYKAIGDVVISGGKNYTNITDLGGGTFSISVPEGTTTDFYDLYINDERATRARLPKTGFYYPTATPTQVELLPPLNPAYPQNGTYELARITIPVNNSIITWMRSLTVGELQKVRVNIYHSWDISIHWIETVSATEDSFTVLGRGIWAGKPMTTSTRLFFENYSGALTAAGEWFQDGDVILYKPKAGETVSNIKVTVPIHNQTCKFTGNSMGEKIKNIHFEDIKFRFSSFVYPNDTGYEAQQAAWNTEGSLLLDYVSNVTFDGCEVSRTGEYGVSFRNGCDNSWFRNGIITKLGCGGVKLGEFQDWRYRFYTTVSDQISQYIDIYNNEISDGGYNIPSGVGVIIGESGYHSVKHNEIHNFYYSGVSVGWYWGTNYNLYAKYNIVEWNTIYNIGIGALSDMAAVYTLGPQQGTKIRYNVIHDVNAYNYGGWGLYTDEGSEFIEYYGNLVYNTKTGGFHQNFGKNNIVKNNVLCYGLSYSLQYTTVYANPDFDFQNNIILEDGSTTLMDGQWQTNSHIQNNNCYYHTSGNPLSFMGMNFATWKATTGHDANSLEQNPGTLNTGTHDFVVDTAVATAIGFVDVDWTLAGIE